MKAPRTSFKKGASGDNPDRVQANASQRDRATIKLLQLRKSGKPVRDRRGKIQHQDFHDRGAAGGQALTAASGRVHADRRWFGNTRVVAQTE